jgi:hypothetical protein
MRFLVAATVAAAGLVLASGASAGSSYNLHPSGFGTHSYAAWKAQQGTTDDTGSANQALYFQKMTTTATIAAGVAVITGVEGTPADELGLSWWHREDGHCGAGAPRWNLGLQDTTTGDRYTVFLGCYAAAHEEANAITNGHAWCKDTQSSIGAEIQGQTGHSASEFTVTGLAIVFDEGTDNPNPPPVGCAQEPGPSGFVYLDNIEVDINGVPHCWTNASDNGNTSSTTCGPPAGTSTTGTTLNLGVPTGVAVDPTDTALVNGLNLAAPDVPLLSWSLYPNVID